MRIYAACVALDHLHDVIARWMMEEQGTRQRALQGVIQLILTEGTYHLCHVELSLVREGVVYSYCLYLSSNVRLLT